MHDKIVFIRGEAKQFGNCTEEDVSWLAQTAEQEAEQSAAWAQWHEEMTRLKGE